MKNAKSLREMVLEIVEEIDYDIYKEAYDIETAEEPEEAEENLERLIAIVKKYFE